MEAPCGCKVHLDGEINHSIVCLYYDSEEHAYMEDF